MLAIFLLVGFNPISSQSKNDTIKNFKNTIRTNITNPMLFGEKYNVIGYERVTWRNQSVSFNVGRFALPKFSSPVADSLKLLTDFKDKGFTFAIDYRFYLKKENKYSAPRGVYVGPYYSFNSLERENTWLLNTSGTSETLVTNMDLNINLIGAQMGYQFVIRNRLAIDLIFFGPGVWFYSVKTSIDTSLDPEEEAMIFENINEMLAAKFPGHEILITPGDQERKSSVQLTSAGFRYLIHLGFRF